MKKAIIIYLCVGLALSIYSAPLSWRTIFKGSPGNIPFWVGLWPWAVVAEAYKQITGEYPDWTPDV